jgi:hypothetical protein
LRTVGGTDGGQRKKYLRRDRVIQPGEPFGSHANDREREIADYE